MSGNFRKEDLRVIKTCKALTNSLLALLNRRNFGQITVNDLCEEALISRATFYTHFNDKYDLLRSWLTNVRQEIVKDIDQYAKIECTVNQFVDQNSRILTNLIENANGELMEILHDFVYSLMDAVIQTRVRDSMQPNYIILTNFCVGGIVNLLSWQVKNRFPPDFPLMNAYFYQLLESIVEWDSKQE